MQNPLTLLSRGARLNGLGRFFIASAAALLIGLLLFYWTMQPPLADLALMVELMGATTLFSVAAAYLAFRAGWILRSTRLRLTLLGGYVLAGMLVFINVWVTARMMFASAHDLALATILLVFATCMAVAVGFFVSETVITRLQQMQSAAGQVAAGKLETRLPAGGRDEMAQLAGAFNEMVVQLEAADRQKRELDVLRRDLIAWVGHDLRTPLTSIRAIVEALADGLVEDEAQRLDYGFDPALLLPDLADKPYIYIGASAFLILAALALTSFRWWMKRLGKRWKQLHRLVYGAGLLVVVHYALAVKGDLLHLSGNIGWPLFYAGLVMFLLGARIPAVRKRIVSTREALLRHIQEGRNAV